jgi:sugar O-acyltransferase (sialic acid O-acetyltransferase NeuD family)
MTAKEQLIILGTHLFAEEVADLVGDSEAFELVGFCENWDPERAGRKLLGLPVFWIDELPNLEQTHRTVCAIGTTKRVDYIRQVAGMGFRFATIQHPSARVSRTSQVGVGCILSAGVIVAAHTRIGEHVILNRGCLIGHHTRIGDYVTISPGANIAGRVVIGEGVYIGMGAVILDSITIGDHAVVGAGAVVTKDVPERVQVMGVPAKITKRGIEGR